MRTWERLENILESTCYRHIASWYVTLVHCLSTTEFGVFECSSISKSTPTTHYADFCSVRTQLSELKVIFFDFGLVTSQDLKNYAAFFLSYRLSLPFSSYRSDMHNGLQLSWPISTSPPLSFANITPNPQISYMSWHPLLRVTALTHSNNPKTIVLQK